MRKLSKNFHFQKTLATIVGRIRWDLGRMFFLNGVHNSKQSRAPCTKGTKNLKIQRIRSHMGRGPQFFQNGDLILSEMGTKRGFRQQKKWDQKMRIFDKLTERR